MTTDNTYNGWTNYETWSVQLWTSNERSEYEFWRERAAEMVALTKGHDDPQAAAMLSLSDALKTTYEESMPESVSGLYADLLQSALDAVNWREIAADMLDALAE